MRSTFAREDDVGDRRDDQVGRTDPVTGLADDLDAGLDTEQHRQSTPEELLVIDDDHAHGLVGGRGAIRDHLFTMAEEGAAGTRKDHSAGGPL